MKCLVKFSNGSLMLSCILILGLGAIFFHALTAGRAHTYIPVAIALLVMCGLSLFYTPMSVRLDDDSLRVCRSLRHRAIPLADISDVKLCPPTMGARRLCGSAGFMGYWGWFSEKDLGRYFAYYGRSSDCFLVTLRDGRRYMIGCEDAPMMVSTIKERLPA